MANSRPPSLRGEVLQFTLETIVNAGKAGALDVLPRLSNPAATLLNNQSHQLLAGNPAVLEQGSQQVRDVLSDMNAKNWPKEVRADFDNIKESGKSASSPDAERVNYLVAANKLLVHLTEEKANQQQLLSQYEALRSQYNSASSAIPEIRTKIEKGKATNSDLSVQIDTVERVITELETSKDQRQQQLRSRDQSVTLEPLLAGAEQRANRELPLPREEEIYSPVAARRQNINDNNSAASLQLPPTPPLSRSASLYKGMPAAEPIYQPTDVRHADHLNQSADSLHLPPTPPLSRSSSSIYKGMPAAEQNYQPTDLRHPNHRNPSADSLHLPPEPPSPLSSSISEKSDISIDSKNSSRTVEMLDAFSLEQQTLRRQGRVAAPTTSQPGVEYSHFEPPTQTASQPALVRRAAFYGAPLGTGASHNRQYKEYNVPREGVGTAFHYQTGTMNLTGATSAQQPPPSATQSSAVSERSNPFAGIQERAQGAQPASSKPSRPLPPTPLRSNQSSEMSEPQPPANSGGPKSPGRS